MVPAVPCSGRLTPDFLALSPMTKVGQRTDDAVVAPAGVLTSHPDHKCLHLAREWRTPRVGTSSGTAKLLSNQPPVPSKNGFGFGDAGDLLEPFCGRTAAQSPQALIDRSGSESRTRTGRSARTMRFSATRNSFCSSNS